MVWAAKEGPHEPYTPHSGTPIASLFSCGLERASQRVLIGCPEAGGEGGSARPGGDGFSSYLVQTPGWGLTSHLCHSYCNRATSLHITAPRCEVGSAGPWEPKSLPELRLLSAQKLQVGVIDVWLLKNSCVFLKQGH